jgi:hypothetical protein
VSATTAPPVGAAAVRLIVPVTVVPPTTAVDNNETLDNAATVVVAVVVESVQAEAAMHTKTIAAPARTPTPRMQFKLTRRHGCGKSRPWCDRTVTSAWQKREDSST